MQKDHSFGRFVIFAHVAVNGAYSFLNVGRATHALVYSPQRHPNRWKMKLRPNFNTGWTGVHDVDDTGLDMLIARFGLRDVVLNTTVNRDEYLYCSPAGLIRARRIYESRMGAQRLTVVCSLKAVNADMIEAHHKKGERVLSFFEWKARLQRVRL